MAVSIQIPHKRVSVHADLIDLFVLIEKNVHGVQVVSIEKNVLIVLIVKNVIPSPNERFMNAPPLPN
jgi:hypothetical protein